MSYTLFVNPSISNKKLPTSKNPASWTPSLFPPSPPETVCRLRRACEETVVWQWALTSLMSVIPLSTSPVITPEGLKFKECSPPLFLLFGHLSPSFWLQRLSLQLLLVHVHFTAVSASSLSRCWIQGSLYSGVYFLLSECPLYSFLFKVSDDADQPTAYHSIIPLSLSLTHTFPLQFVCDVWLTSLSVFFLYHCLSIFVFSFSRPYGKCLPLRCFLQSDWVIRGNESLSASETDKGERRVKHLRPPEKSKAYFSHFCRLETDYH